MTSPWLSMYAALPLLHETTSAGEDNPNLPNNLLHVDSQTIEPRTVRPIISILQFNHQQIAGKSNSLSS